jgi:hypothetical protein
MRRVFLGVGDEATNGAFITEGLDSVSCSNPPPCVQISTLGMRTYCPACKREGYIAPRGPRWPGTGPNGKEWALSGDVNVCGCSPPPEFHAERNIEMIFTAEEADRLTGKHVVRASIGSASCSSYDEQIRIRGNLSALAGYPYFIETESGTTHSGRVDSNGLLPRVFTDNESGYYVYWGDEALAHEEYR